MISRASQLWRWLVAPTVPDARPVPERGGLLVAGLDGGEVCVFCFDSSGWLVFNGCMTPEQATRLGGDLWSLGARAAMAEAGVTTPRGA